MERRFERLEHIDKVVEMLNFKAQDVDVFTEQFLSKMDKEYSKIREFYIEAKRLETENEGMENKCAALEESIREKKVKTTRLQQTLEDLDRELTILHAEHESIFAQCEDAKRRQQPTEEDKRILQEAKLKLSLYQELTNVKWDYTRKENEPPRGYVLNKKSGYRVGFTLKGGDLGAQREELWNNYITPATENSISTAPTCPN